MSFIERLYRALDFLKYTLLHPQWLSNRFHRLSRLLLNNVAGATVLDIGSGDSHHSDIFSAENRIIRLDYPATNQHYRLIPDIYASACQLPFASNSLNVVLLLEVLEHIECPDQALQEIARTLEPSGKLYLSVPFIYPIHDAPSDYRRFTLFGLRKFLQQHNFDIVSETTHGNSLVTTMQLFNLALLEVCRGMAVISAPAAIVLGTLLYPVMILINLLSLPLLSIKQLNAANFGYFIVAKKISEPALPVS